MSLLLEPIIIGEPVIINLENKNYTNYKKYFNIPNVKGYIEINDTDDDDIKLLHIINKSLHFYSKNVVINKINNSVDVYLMCVPPEPSTNIVEKLPYINHKRVKFNINNYEKIVLLHQEFYGYYNYIETEQEKKDRLKYERSLLKEKLHNEKIKKLKKEKNKKRREDNLILMNKAKNQEEIISSDISINNLYYGVENFCINDLENVNNIINDTN
jgi:hypothetical protein